MQIEKLEFRETGQFSKAFLNYIEEDPKLKPFYHYTPQIANFEKQIAEKRFSADQRRLLAEVLEQQYKKIKSSTISAQIDSLREDNTYTVTTGHQLNLFTGPMYVIYKLITTINACKSLKKKYPAYNFIPIYWMASEDHDFEEIDHFRLNGKVYRWDSSQSGAVGRFTLNDIQDFLDQIPGVPAFMKEAYLESDNLAEAVRKYLHHLFGEEGLVILDADNAQLKSSFKEVIERDMFTDQISATVATTTAELEQLGYKAQITARDINFFYLVEGLRERLEFKENRYTVVDTDISFSETEVKELIAQHPEKLSPNVILRPLYQEMILPNLAYIGGPSELVYWLQLKGVFDLFNVPFPLLMPRNFGMVLPHQVQRKIEKLGLNISELFKDQHHLQASYVKKISDIPLSVNGEKEDITTAYESLRQRALAIDPTLGPHVAAQLSKAQDILEKIEKKFVRAEKRKQTDKLNQLMAVVDYMFPNGGLQERTDNFLNFYLSDNQFIARLLSHLDPFDFRFNLIKLGE